MDNAYNVHEPSLLDTVIDKETGFPYGIFQDVIEFVKNNSSKEVLNALRNYYSF